MLLLENQWSVKHKIHDRDVYSIGICYVSFATWHYTYWHDDYLIVRTGDITDLELQRKILPDKANGPQRAANQVYWIDNFITPDERIGVELQKQIYPNKADGQSRTSNYAYWHEDYLIIRTGDVDDL